MAFYRKAGGAVSVWFLPVVRPDKTLLWVPCGIAKRLKLKAGSVMTKKQFDDEEVTAMLNSRALNTSAHCSVEWHIKNGYT